MKPLFEFLYGPPLRLLGFVYCTFKLNRERLAAFKNDPRVAKFIRISTVLILVAWVVVWLTASEESRERLTEKFLQSFGQQEAPAQE